MCFVIMPISGLCRPERIWLEQAAAGMGCCVLGQLTAGGIILLSLQALEERQQWIFRFERLAGTPSLDGLSQGLLLEGQIGIQIDLRGLDRLMP